jgi:hypothetical protein
MTQHVAWVEGPSHPPWIRKRRAGGERIDEVEGHAASGTTRGKTRWVPRRRVDREKRVDGG